MFKNTKPIQHLKYYMLIDAILILMIILVPIAGGRMSVLMLLIALSGFVCTWDLKAKYTGMDEVVHLPIYFFVLFILPILIKSFLIYIGIDSETLDMYKVAPLLFLMSKYILYFRTYRIFKKLSNE